jgi:hypothetical protein
MPWCLIVLLGLSALSHDLFMRDYWIVEAGL